MPPSTILVIEDDAATRYAYRRTLTAAGYTVEAVSDGAFGLAWLRAHPDECALVLLDLITPDVNGWKFLFQCRSDPELRNLPVVVVTGALSPGEKLIGLAPRALLYKPVEAGRLLATVKEHCLPAGESASE